MYTYIIYVYNICIICIIERMVDSIESIVISINRLVTHQ